MEKSIWVKGVVVIVFVGQNISRFPCCNLSQVTRRKISLIGQQLAGPVGGVIHRLENPAPYRVARQG